MSTGKRSAVPLLLSSFPVPPTHIPSTPLSARLPSPLPSPNPPLSGPPLSPLPPVPGPSPISEHDTLRFISAERSRRASKMSMASTASMYSRRDSVATEASLSSSNPPPLSPTTSYYESASTRSIRSLSSVGSAAHPHARYAFDKSPMFEPRICEEDPAELSQMSLTEITPPHLSDVPPSPSMNGLSDSEAEGILDLGIGSSILRGHRGRRAHGMNDSIASIDINDLPALQEDETELLSAPPILPSPSKPSHLRPVISNRPRPPTAVLYKDLPPLPHSAPPEASSSYLRRSGSVSTTHTAYARDGAESPDIATIIATTPRPRRKSSSQFSNGSRSRSRPNSTRRSRGSSVHRSGTGSRRTSDAVAVPVPPLRFSGDVGYSELAYTRREHDEDEESDYGELIDGTGTTMDSRMLSHEAEARLERALEGFDTEDDLDAVSDGNASDSSIDVQTPLPNLMLRDGMLSPSSKLLPQSIRAPTPCDRHLSVQSSSASIMTKSGIFKDERDTVKRRVRHRDGTLLRGGIGLTTGLGWSDSEDEDAPSPLTRRISSMVVSRRASSSSMSSSVTRQIRPASNPHPLSRSVSETLSSAAETLARQQGQMRSREGRPSQPPTSWPRASTSSTSSYGSNSRLSNGSSVLSSSSRRTSDTLSHIREHDGEHERDDAGFATPSTASDSSMAMPLTPVNDDDGRQWESRKTPAPLRIPSNKSLRAPPPSKPSSSSMPFPRERTTSMSSNGSLSKSALSVSPTSPAIPRPLRLPQTQTSRLKPKSSTSSLRAPTTSLRNMSSNASLSSSVRSASTAKLPKPAAPLPSAARSNALSEPAGGIRPSVRAPVTPDRKPRTGTGMVYRSASGAPRQSMMRVPSSTTLRSAAAKV